METDTGLITEQETDVRLDDGSGDHDRFAHVVWPKSAVMEAMVTGTPCTALCGKKWIPSRDPRNYPICPTCKEIMGPFGKNLPEG